MSELINLNDVADKKEREKLESYFNTSDPEEPWNALNKTIHFHEGYMHFQERLLVKGNMRLVNFLSTSFKINPYILRAQLDFNRVLTALNAEIVPKSNRVAIAEVFYSTIRLVNLMKKFKRKDIFKRKKNLQNVIDKSSYYIDVDEKVFINHDYFDLYGLNKFNEYKGMGAALAQVVDEKIKDFFYMDDIHHNVRKDPNVYEKDFEELQKREWKGKIFMGMIGAYRFFPEKLLLDV